MSCPASVSRCSLPAVLVALGLQPAAAISSPRTSPGGPTRSGPACPPAWCARAPSSKPAPSLGGPSVCGAIRPFAVAAAARGSVQLRPAALLRCPMVPAVDHWVERVVMPAARHHLRRQRGRAEGGGLLFLPRHEPRRRRAPVRARPRQRHRRLGLRAGRRPHGAGQDRLVGRVAPSAISCALCIAAPATCSPRCSAPTTTPTTATTSTSTSPGTAATARTASASRPARP